MVIVQKAITMNKNDFEYLKENGIGRSEFMRQAVDAHRQGKLCYDRSLQK